MSRTSTARSRPRLHLETLEDRLAPASLPVGFSESVIASGLTNPTAMEIAPDGKLFILEQAGTAEVWQDGTRLTSNFFAGTSLTTAAVDYRGERGLLGLAFDPNYASNRFLYVYYTVDDGTPNNRISRFTANAAGTQALAGSEQVILNLAPLSSATNHNGGAIHFGLDGMLYVAVGDNANRALAQSLGSEFGKVLRLDVDGAPLIPSDNPFVGVQGANGAIWALGLRNPYTFDVHAGNGDIYVNDVGERSWEEINKLVRAGNYGWPATEGPFDPAAFPNFLNPRFAYPHPGVVPGATITGTAITGAAFYDPATNLFPTDYGGNGYFFADLGSGFIKRYDTRTERVRDFASGAQGPVDLDVTRDGKLLYLSFFEGRAYEVTFTAPPGGLLPDGSVGTALERFVAGAYRDVLGRQISVGEIQNGTLNAHVAFAGQFGLSAFVLALQNSAEARLRLIEGRYQDYLGRSADAAGRASWLAFLQGGGTIEQFQIGLLSSPEYQSKHGNDLSRIVDALYDDVLGRGADPAGKAAFLGGLQGGQLRLDQAVLAMLNSTEYRARLVQGYYRDYLGRDADAAGLNGWVSLLSAGVRDEEVLALILGNPAGEYFNRVVF